MDSDEQLLHTQSGHCGWAVTTRYVSSSVIGWKRCDWVMSDSHATSDSHPLASLSFGRACCSVSADYTVTWPQVQFLLLRWYNSFIYRSSLRCTSSSHSDTLSVIGLQNKSFELRSQGLSINMSFLAEIGKSIKSVFNFSATFWRSKYFIYKHCCSMWLRITVLQWSSLSLRT